MTHRAWVLWQSQPCLWSKWSIILLLQTVCVMTHRAEVLRHSQLFVSNRSIRLRSSATVSCLCPNGPSDCCCGLFVPLGLGLPAQSTQTGSKWSIRLLLRAVCVMLRAFGTVSFWCPIGPSDCCCGLCVMTHGAWVFCLSQLFVSKWSIRLLLRPVCVMTHQNVVADCLCDHAQGLGPLAHSAFWFNLVCEFVFADWFV